MFNSRSQTGFTLVELLIVVAIIGLLATGVLMVMNPSTYFRNSRDARRKSDLQSIRTAVELFYAGNSSYPTSGLGMQLDLQAIGSGSWVSGSVTYLQKTPVDPSSGAGYCYNKTASGYILCAPVEGTAVGAGTCTPTGAALAVSYNHCVTNTF